MQPPAVQPDMKRDGRTVSHSALEEMGTVAYARMLEGESPAEVSASFGMHRGWAYKLRSKAKGRGKGRRALQSTRGSGRPPKLSATQQRQVFRWANGKNPMQHGFEFALWTRQIVRELIEREFSVRLSLATVGTLLAKLGLTVQKSISAASAVNSKGGFWFATYVGALNSELFVRLLKQMMRGRRKLASRAAVVDRLVPCVVFPLNGTFNMLLRRSGNSNFHFADKNRAVACALAQCAAA